ncbi:hypothetical protein GTO89_12060 [Heliobacterium gestii]|uniref:Actin-like protein N-terminal domain-containing protein n=1 Tax=Heliomicrobium gestii TaxID=2699 RepID=A0A845LC69_HELGE|nr:ParM/StbA family protein [Heliomicrobium gestii]MBM7867223.1 plasmid segregation protein ParM [Heliomicrobium gestii]MZP43778.1 hypothetical protein [Heliomicrobium gestii]
MSIHAARVRQLPGFEPSEGKNLTVGLDIGFGYVKVVAGNGRWALFPSIVGEGRELHILSGFGSNDPMDNLVVDVDGRRYFVGNLALRETEAELDIDPDKIFNVDFEVLVYTALALVSDKPDQDVNIYLGLPINFYRTQKARFEDKLRAHQMSRFVKVLGQDVRLIRIRNFEIFPQAGGAIFNQILDFRSEVRTPRLARGKIGIIDGGTKTTDCIYMEDLKFVDQRSFSVNDGGTHKILMDIRDFLMKNFDHYYPRLAEVDQMLRERKVEVKGKVYDITSVIDASASRVARKIVREISAKWPNHMEFRAMILVGGGGYVMHPFLKETFPDILLVQDEFEGEAVAGDWNVIQFANALGFLKLAVMRYGENK